MEEPEAVDGYNQRVDACKDHDLKAILAHNRDEEKEHAAMVLQWIRRQAPAFDKELGDDLFTSRRIAHGQGHPGVCRTHEASTARQGQAVKMRAAPI